MDVMLDTSMPLNDRYRIFGSFASGGMASIYLAEARTADGFSVEVALKRLLPELHDEPDYVQMFYDEARVASLLRHPNIPRALELGELDGSLFIAMELIRGVHLRDVLSRMHRRNERIPIDLAVKIGCEVLQALSYAHDLCDDDGHPMHLVHRDVSPHNILVTYDGEVKLLDFGVSRSDGQWHQTAVGTIKGKVAYMSPEQLGGEAHDARTDVFALGEVLYELMLHQHPFFDENDPSMLMRILDDVPAPDPREIDPDFPEALADILNAALSKDPEARPTSRSMLRGMRGLLRRWGDRDLGADLADVIRALFVDRLELERSARARSDGALMVEALACGRVEDGPRSHLLPPTEPDFDGSAALDLFERDTVPP